MRGREVLGIQVTWLCKFRKLLFEVMACRIHCVHVIRPQRPEAGDLEILVRRHQ
jgi:hypothetical protein